MINGNLIQRKKVAHIFSVEILNQNFAEIDSILYGHSSFVVAEPH